MKINSIEIQDTYGSLKEIDLKIDASRQTLSGWFTDAETMTKRILTLSPSNIDFETLNGEAEGVTYKQVLQYNGTLNTKSNIFTQILVDKTTIAKVFHAPTLEYSPDGLPISYEEDYIDERVLDLDFHTGQADVLEFRQGELRQGEKKYRTEVWKHSYPTIVRNYPNVDDNVVYLDGWYTYSFVRFVDITEGQILTAGRHYGYKGEVFKCTVNGSAYPTDKGVFVSEESDGEPRILEIFPMGKTVEDIKSMRSEVATAEGPGDLNGRAFLDSQILITDEIRDEIIAEVICASENIVKSNCDFLDWQKLTISRQAAYVMFENGLFRNAQKVIEASRKMCRTRTDRKC